MGTVNLLEAIRHSECDPFIQICSTSEVFGLIEPDEVPITLFCITERGVMNPALTFAWDAI